MAWEVTYDLRTEISDLNYPGIHAMLPLTAILVASKAMAASKRPRRSHLTSELNSVTLITYVPISLWPLTVTIHLIFPEGQTPSIDFVSSTEVKIEMRDIIDASAKVIIILKFT